MTQVTIDSELLVKLKAFSEPLELVDSTGRVLAQVLPVQNGNQRKLPGEPNWDEEDLRRQELANERRYTTAEVLEHLRKLGNQASRAASAAG